MSDDAHDRNSLLVTYSFVVFAQRSMDDATVEEYFRGVGNIVKGLQRLLEFIVVVMPQGGDPSLDFLEARSAEKADSRESRRLTCFNDIVVLSEGLNQ